MNIGNCTNSNQSSFGAKFKIVQNKSFVKPEYFDEWLAENQKNWEWEAYNIGSDKDTITLTLGKNGIKQGGVFLKQNLIASAKINGIKIKNDDLNFQYMKIGNEVSRYFGNFSEKVEDYLRFIKRLSECKINK